MNATNGRAAGPSTWSSVTRRRRSLRLLRNETIYCDVDVDYARQAPYARSSVAEISSRFAINIFRPQIRTHTRTRTELSDFNMASEFFCRHTVNTVDF